MPKNNDIEKLDTLQSVELGEGVEIRLRIAGPFPRALALLLDLFIMIGITIVIGLVILLISMGVGLHVGEGLRLVLAFFLSWGYFVYFEMGKHGATIGKRTLGLRVVDRSGNSAKTSQIFVRNILRLVDMLPGIPTTGAGFLIGSFGLGFVCCLFTKKFQRIGDLVANTLVVYTQPDFVITGQLPKVEQSIAPSIALSREEQMALSEYYNRAGLWSEARRIELSDHASELTKQKGMAGMVRLLGIAKWTKEKG